MKKFLSLVMALALTVSLVTVSAGAKDFTDDSKLTYGEAVDVISAIGVVDGYTDGSFNPSATLTRGAAAKIICNLILGPTTAGALGVNAAPFKDVPVSNVFAGYIAYCSQQGIINGYADGTFKPSATVTGYQFMKMLLGALGYDGSVEGFTGANWTVAVAKLAVSIGLDDGNDSFVGSAAMTREEAALYAYNTLNATMVEYDSKSSVTVNGVTVATGASDAKQVANNASTETVKNDNLMQFGEKYFSKLTKSTGMDDFARPATTWKFKNDKIGTYADKADVSYTADQKLGTIYTDLGLSNKITANVYYNGVEGTDVLVSKGNSVKLSATNAEVGNGTQIEVYYDSDADTIDIVEIATYVGQINKSVAATSSKDAYVVVNKLSGPITSSTNQFETTASFDDDAIVLYTFANGEIQSVALADSVTGTLSSYTSAKSVTVGGTTYKYTAQKAFETSESALSTKGDYTVYLDAYGYMAYIEEQAAVSSDYAYVLDLQSSGSFSENKASLVLADGTKKVVVCDDDYADINNDGNATNTDTYKNMLVTYKANDAGEYVLKAVSGTPATLASSTTFNLSKSTSAITVATSGANAGTVYANSNSVFVVRTASDTYKAYTGIANVPNVSGSVSIAYYCKTSGMITFAYIDATSATVTNSSNDVVYLAKASKSAKIVDSDNNEYYTYNAVVNGDIQTVKVLAATSMDATNMIDGVLSTNTAFNGVTYNSDDIVKALTAPAGSTKTGIAITKLSGDDVIGVTLTGGTSTTYYTVAKDCNVYYIDSDGNISASSTSAITKADDVTVVFTENSDHEVNYIFIQEPASGSAQTPGTPAANLSSITMTSTTLTATMTGAASAATSYDVTLSVLNSGTFVPMGSFTVTVASGSTTGSTSVGSLGAGTYKLVCGSYTTYVTLGA